MRFPSQAARDATMRTGMESGSRACYTRLDGYLDELAADDQPRRLEAGLSER